MRGDKDERLSCVACGVCFDLAIALCALLISTLAASASWWQARLLETQAHALQEEKLLNRKF